MAVAISKGGSGFKASNTARKKKLATVKKSAVKKPSSIRRKK